MILGAHVSTQGGVDNAPANGVKLGITAIQIFAKNQRQWVAKPLEEDSIARWHEQVKAQGITHAVSHASYLINLCAIEDEKLEKSINSLTDELQRAEALGLSHVVFHPGSHLKEGEEWGIKTIAKSINEIHKRTKGFTAKLALENTAGQGTNLGYTFEQLRGMIDGVKEAERLSVCFDTCHAFAAGYDLVGEEGYEKTFESFDEIIGLDLLQVIHLNDTKKEHGSRRDRHDQIGEGHLGLEPFRRLMHDSRFKDVPAILETPEGEEGYPRDLKTLRGLMH
jgi:deoxyribonuclease-4